MKKLNQSTHSKMLLACSLFITLFFTNVLHAQRVTSDVQQKLKAAYKNMKNTEISFERFSEINSHVLSDNAKKTSALSLATYCNNVRPYCTGGDFESGLDQTQYTGAYGFHYNTLYPNPFASTGGTSITFGFTSGAINSGAAHQTIVSGAGNDPNVPIPLVPPGGGNQALRLGNSVSGNGFEILAKTLTVDANETILNFYYAVVLEDPGHPFNAQPAFSVRAYDCATGLELPNVCDLGNGTNIVVSDANNPFFQSANFGSIAYRDWSLAQIDLSAHVGKNVIIVFTNKDCDFGGHYGYTYLDNLFSGQCPRGPITTNQGSVVINTAGTATCGSGQICANYTLPFTNNNGVITNGDITLTMRIFQGGVQVGSLASPLLTSGTSHCFNVADVLPLVDANLPGFDYSITAAFNLSGFALSPLTVGNPPNGVVAGQNNDFLFVCPTNGTCTAPTFLNTLPIVGDATCGLSDGQISIIPLSGTAPFMYSLDGGATYVPGPNVGFTQFNLPAGNYQLRLKDANGCESAIVTRTVGSINCNTCTPPTFLNTLPIVGDATCGLSDGQISIIPLSGTAPFMYSLDGGATYVPGPNVGFTQFNLPAGTYQLRLKDANGCESAVVTRVVGSINCVTCTPPTFLNTRPIVGDATCNLSDGQISIIPTSGTGPFMYSIDGGATYVAGPNVGYTFFNLPAGIYQLKMKDASGCETANVQREVMSINCPPAPTATAGRSSAQQMLVIDEGKMTVNSYPNPSRGKFRIQVQNMNAPKAEVSIFDAKGNLVKKSIMNLTKGNILDMNLSGQAPGMYYMKVVTNTGTNTTKVMIK